MTSPHDSAFLRATRGEPVDHTPVWYMRQAGRSLPEYLRIREGIGMLESCMDPDLVTEITLQPVRRYAVDAAIFFSDIVLPLKAVGVDLDIVPGVGPVVAHPVRTLEDVAAIPDLDARTRAVHHRPRSAHWSASWAARRSSVSRARRSRWRRTSSRAGRRRTTRRPRR